MARDSSGVKENNIKITEEALSTLIKSYCRESGVRNLQKHIEKVRSTILVRHSFTWGFCIAALCWIINDMRMLYTTLIWRLCAFRIWDVMRRQFMLELGWYWFSCSIFAVSNKAATCEKVKPGFRMIAGIVSIAPNLLWRSERSYGYIPGRSRRSRSPGSLAILSGRSERSRRSRQSWMIASDQMETSVRLSRQSGRSKSIRVSRWRQQLSQPY